SRPCTRKQLTCTGSATRCSPGSSSLTANQPSTAIATLPGGAVPRRWPFYPDPTLAAPLLNLASLARACDAVTTRGNAMKIGVFTVLFQQLPFEEALDLVRSAGVEAVGIGP